jgi:hypothetical protein
VRRVNTSESLDNESSLGWHASWSAGPVKQRQIAVVLVRQGGLREAVQIGEVMRIRS